MANKRESTRIPRRPLGIAAATVVVAASIGIPTAAYAADPLSDDVFYASSASGQPGIYTVDPVSGALSDPGLGAPTAVNQVGVSRDGSHLAATDATRVHLYTASTGAWTSVLRSTGPSVPNTHGAIDPLTGHMFYGGLSGSTIMLAEYDPSTNTIASKAIAITVAGAPGGNGDIAFDGNGNAYLVLGSAATTGATAYSRLYRIDRADLASGSGTAVQLGGDIDATALNSIAFGQDGYLYVAGGLNAQSDYIKIDPGTGETVEKLTLSTRITDLGSTAVPRTVVVGVETPGGLVDEDDSFTVVIENSDGDDLGTGETDGDGAVSVGPVLTVPDREYDISITPGATTNPDDYTTTWECTDGAGDTIASGTGVSGSFTYPGSADEIDCVFVNVPRALPAAVDDEDLRNTQGSSVTIAVVGNDTGDALDPTSVRIVDGAGRVSELVVDGEGTWSVNPTTSAITFAPEDGFTGNPTPITYEIADTRGHTAQAAVVITYLPIAADDEDLDNAPGADVTVPVIANDSGEGLDPASVRIIDPATGDRVTELVVPGEGTWTVDIVTGDITFSPEGGFLNDPTPIAYQVTDAEGETAQAEVVVTYLATATDDVSTRNAPGTVVSIPVLDNDSDDVDPTSIRITDPETGDPVTELEVPGQGTWAVDPATGEITFTPEGGFDGNPTPIVYTGEDADGNSVEATVTVTYLPAAADDEDLDNTIGSPVVVSVVDNDSANVDPSTVRITDPETREPVTELVVAGEGTWTVDTDTGAITFTPQDGFIGDPTVIEYTIADAEGNPATAAVTVTYASDPADDEDLGNTIGEPVTVTVVSNDPAGLDPATVKIIDPETGDPVTELPVPGQGTWTVDPGTGDITFTPEEGFEGNPTPIDYVFAPEGQKPSAPATVTIGYQPVAADDSDLGNAPGSAVVVDVLGNDHGSLVPETVRIIDPHTGEGVIELVVAGQGTWTVDQKTGEITFTPAPGFRGDPTPIEYSVQDDAGVTATATVTVTYLAPASGGGSAATGGLATTGGQAPWGLAGLGALLLGLAGAALAFARRRLDREA